ncbi:MAG: outer membrane lipoprotein carrier protein LolA [Cycloclasticus sp. symbiont of Poecilosclerida sp. N]|nr:MAG: outer membrane lipoprotein carrier protein LolA [Cycloclasticus sp. symbiont of Poecilosclerida sp. N]
MKFYDLVCLITLLFYSSYGFAKTSEDSLQSHLKQYKYISGQFTQVLSGEQQPLTQSSTGEFWIKKPDKFRWNYITPYVQKIISNGSKLWVYDEDLEQVTIKHASQSIQSSPLAVILGSVSLSELFDIETLDNNDSLQWLKLTPKTDSGGFDFINVGFRQGVMSQMVLKDSFGQTTHLLFTNVTVHTPIADEIFEFKVPNDADLFDETIAQ